MKILHLFGNWRWTGPAQPVLASCRLLQERGHEVVVAHEPRPPSKEYHERLTDQIAAEGLRSTDRFPLRQPVIHPHSIPDALELARYLREERFDIVHSHYWHDHQLAALAIRLVGRNRPILVRSLHEGYVLDYNPLRRFLLNGLTDGICVFTEGFRLEYLRRFRLREDRVRVLPMTVDTQRFRPRPAKEAVRRELGLPPEGVIGIVSKPQSHRRFDVIWEAAAKVVAELPETRFVVLGRSHEIPWTVTEPVGRLGIEKNVILGGYREQALDYLDVMACFDIVSLLKPGTDGTARAIREAFAMGIPCVVSDYGMLPEVVEDGRTGRVVPCDPEALAQAWLELLRDPQRRKAMGARARAVAEQRFDLGRMVDELEALYVEWSRGRRLPRREARKPALVD